MRRRYQREHYAHRVEKIKSLMPNCCIGVDVIVGFPGETKEDFLETYEFLNQLNISYLHVFTYSERDHTLAAELPDSVPMSQRQERSRMLHILSDKKKRAFYQENCGTVTSVLFENFFSFSCHQYCKKGFFNQVSNFCFTKLNSLYRNFPHSFSRL